jgi:monofunctional glycosyltransferase
VRPPQEDDPDFDPDARVGARLARGLAIGAALALAAVLLVGLWYFGWILLWRYQDPVPTAFMRAELRQLQSEHPREQPPPHLQQQWVPYERISANLKRAVIASEDARFLVHDGVDWEAVEKAYANNKAGGRVHGASTISQQVAKNLFLSGSRSYLRKGEELLITYMLEFTWTKRRILEVYLNVAEWGDGIFGAEAAARHYYGVSAAQLDAEQSARMAAFLPSPKRYGKIRVGGYLDARTAEIQRWMTDSTVP